MVSENAKRIEIDLDRFHFFVVKHDQQFFIPTNEGLRLKKSLYGCSAALVPDAAPHHRASSTYSAALNLPFS